MHKQHILSSILIIITTTLSATNLPSFGGDGGGSWPTPPPEARPYTRWWWLGSAVDEEGLRYNLTEYARAGIGGVEITPIYGVKGNDAHNIDYLSPRWMQMLATVERLCDSLGIEVNMATGTGWPFGGPWVPTEEAAAKLKVENGKLLTDRTRQKVKRAAPGGDGYVVDHFDRQSVVNYLHHFDQAFAESGVKYPHTFFNDSYEVYGADWTPRLLDEFHARRGYRLDDFTTLFLSDPKRATSETQADSIRRIMSDYRETLSDLLYDNFTTVWTEWAHSHGAITRNQAHGSPANLIDLYARVDIPECEGFGLSDFHIRGLRTDPGMTKANYSDLSMLKYASSGAHISGKRLTSSETFTWLTEHFRTSFSQCKPDFDLMMVAGVNHIFFHGSCYTPKDDPWPGWKFYASIDMSPTNNLWRDAPAFYKYIERVQTFMQLGEPDNDILVYLPFHDMIYAQPGRLVQFDIHSMAERAPQFIASINAIIRAGFDCDYISDRYLLQTQVIGNQLSTTGRNRYAAIVVPNVEHMPLATLQQLFILANQGAHIIFIGGTPTSAPGLHGLDIDSTYQATLQQIRAKVDISNSYDIINRYAKPEPMRTNQGLSMIRRTWDGGRYIYFISNLQERDIDQWVDLGRTAQYATFYNPMNGNITAADISNQQGPTRVRLQLRSGESIIMVLSDENNNLPRHPYLSKEPQRIIAITDWTLRFIQSAPTPIKKTYKMHEPQSWTQLGHQELNETMATGVYKANFSLTMDARRKTQDERGNMGERFILDLGDVRETARIRINDTEVATLFAVPYTVDVTTYIKRGKNTIEVEVSNLGANRISRLDRDGIEWRKFEEINVVDLNYKNTRYDRWAPMPSGLCSAVKLLCYETEN
ncbi:MAG: glycosyl hydrolase family 2 [Bacteroidaceae bacterium]|nr:glycosyl hydrolase family 2 [Bacteroidaceae bacterium]